GRLRSGVSASGERAHGHNGVRARGLMAFWRSTAPDLDSEIRGREVYLRQPVMGDYAAWAELRALSRQHLTIWEPQWSRDELARSAFRRRLRQYQRELRDDQGYAFLIF